MGQISRETFRKLVVLGVIAEYGDGVYGSKRLQKVIYLGSRTSEIKPFSYVKYHYGQFSQELDDIKDQLLSMGLICVEPIQSAHGVRLAGNFFPSNSGNIYRLCGERKRFQDLFGSASKDLKLQMSKAVKAYGYLEEAKLLEIVYSLPEFQEKEKNELIFESQLPERIDVGLDDEECDELELALNLRTVQSAAHVLKGLENTPIDFSALQPISR